jgi:hypothetical protein
MAFSWRINNSYSRRTEENFWWLIFMQRHNSCLNTFNIVSANRFQFLYFSHFSSSHHHRNNNNNKSTSVQLQTRRMQFSILFFFSFVLQFLQMKCFSKKIIELMLKRRARRRRQSERSKGFCCNFFFIIFFFIFLAFL